MAFALLFLPGLATGDVVPAGPEFRVNTYTTSDQSIYPQSLCRGADGGFVVVWETFLPDDVFGQRFDSAGARLGGEFRANTYPTGRQSTARVACDAAGNFVVVWNSMGQDGSFGGSFGQRFARDGTRLGVEFRLNGYTTNNQIRAVVGVDAAGNFVAVWDDASQEGSAFGVFGRRFDSAGTPLGTEFRVNTYTTGDQLGVHLAVAPGGEFVVVWRSDGQDGDGQGVFAQAFASTGDRAGPEFRVNAFTTELQNVNAVTPDGAGGFVAVWSNIATGSMENGAIARRISAAGAPVGTEFRVHTYAPSAGFAPAVAADADGDLVFVWSSGFLDGDGSGIFGRRYDSSGVPVGTEFRVNTYTPGPQGASSAVAADVDGDFIVVWNSLGQDGDGFGVYAQRFQDPCGNGALETGEQCDVGDRRPGAGRCCSPTCQALAAGAACPDDGVACTADACDGGGACAHVARADACVACEACDPSLGCVARARTDCRHPRQASLLLANRSRDAKDRLAFGWKKGAATTVADLGDPLASTGYALCVFDRQGGTDRLVLKAAAPAGAGWRKAGRRGFRFRARTGLASVAVKSGADGKASAAAAGKGGALALPGLGLTPPVEAQLQAGPGGACFAGTFAAPRKNTPALFRAKGD
jgi:hypothetical protein